MNHYVFVGLPHRHRTLFLTGIRNCDADMWDIVNAACREFNVDERVLFSKARSSNVSLCRFTAMSIMRESLRLKLQVIGDFFNRNHASVINAVRTYNNLFVTDREFRMKAIKIKRSI